jgi:heterodisulfide reductase subunit B
MRYAYFPGCAARSSAYDYHLSLKYVTQVLGIDWVELKDWVCCGAVSGPATSHLLSIALPLFNLARAERNGFEKLIAPCPECFSRFKKTQKALEQEEDLQDKMARILEAPYHGKVTVLHPLEIFQEIGGAKIREKVRHRLSGLRIACYYGCLLTRPPDVCQFDQVENPQSMDSIVRALGAEPVDWPFKTDCCGSFMALTYSDVVLRLGNQILLAAEEAGANALAVACSLCQSNLDSRQGQMEELYGTRHRIPVLYITQWMGLAFGAFPREIGLEKLITPPQEVLGSIGLM